MNFEQEASQFVIERAIGQLKQNIGDDEQQEYYIKTLTETISTLCQKSISDKSIHLSLFEAVLFSCSLEFSDKVNIFTSLTKIDIFESELLLPVLVRTLVKKYKNDMAMPKGQLEHLKLTVMTETLAKFISERNVEISPNLEASPSYTIEFICDNPNSLHTLPNKLLSVLERRMAQKDSAENWMLHQVSTKKVLLCLTAVRPLHQNSSEELAAILAKVQSSSYVLCAQ